MTIDQRVTEGGGFRRDVRGIFYRAVETVHIDAALAGSRQPGRYSASDQPTLYLSASREGVAAAMPAHTAGDAGSRTVLRFHVEATDIFDLRDQAAIAEVRAAAGEPFGAWQRLAGSGVEPPSWRVRRWVEGQGMHGLIDPSREAPGLWHLALFRWNVPGAPTVKPVEQ
jgi:RES domain-containing protein